MKQKRESNIELMRIVCMVLIIAHHCVLHGGAVNMDPCANKWISLFIWPGGKLCFDAFLAISMWFLVDQDFRAERFLKLWLETLFYSVLFTIAAAYGGVSLTGKDMLAVCLPITGNVHGFAAAYLVVYAFIPFLNAANKKMSKRQLQILLSVLFVANVFSLVIGNYVDHFQKIYDNVGFWLFCYYLSLYLKRYKPALEKKRWLHLTVFAASWLFLAGLQFGKALWPENALIKYLLAISQSHTAIVAIVGGYALFFLFKGIKIRYSPVINTVARTTFGILMIHDHNFFRPVLWKGIIHADTWYFSRFFVARVGLSVLFVFTCGMLIDFVRIYLLEKPLFANQKLRQTLHRFDDMYNNVGSEEILNE